MKDDKANMVDILDSMKLAMTYLGSMTLNDFEKTIEKVDAICRRLEIIGEATKRLSLTLRQTYPEVPWQQMTGMRDRIIHGYDVIRIDRVHETVALLIPQVVPVIEFILESLPDPK
jgi:uncharacterized protein with HEPN domain